MKFRNDFVTNSSSASFIICFARISNREKANKTLEEYGLYEYIRTADEVNKEKNCFGELGADWCGATIDVDYILKKYPDSEFIIIEERNEADYDEDCEPSYDYNFNNSEAIEKITTENGFDNIEIAEGEGFDG